MKVNGIQVPDEVTNELRAFIRAERPTVKALTVKTREVARLWRLGVAAPAVAARMLKAKSTREVADA